MKVGNKKSRNNSKSHNQSSTDAESRLLGQSVTFNPGNL